MGCSCDSLSAASPGCSSLHRSHSTAQVSAGEVVYKLLPVNPKRKIDLREDDPIFVALPAGPHDLVSRNIAIGIRVQPFKMKGINSQVVLYWH